MTLVPLAWLLEEIAIFTLRFDRNVSLVVLCEAKLTQVVHATNSPPRVLHRICELHLYQGLIIELTSLSILFPSQLQIGWLSMLFMQFKHTDLHGNTMRDVT